MSDEAAVALAIDLGGTKVSLAVVDAEGACSPARAGRRTRTARRWRFDALAAAANETVRAAGLGWTQLRGVGVVVPGIYSPATGRAWAPNLWGRDEVPLRDELAARLPARFRPAGDRLRPLRLRARRAVAGRGPRLHATSSSSRSGPGSAPASSRAAGWCAAAAASPARSAGSRSTRAGATTTPARAASRREAAGPAFARRAGARDRRAGGRGCPPRRRAGAARGRRDRRVARHGPRQPDQRAEPAGDRARRRADAGRRPVPSARAGAGLPLGAAARGAAVPHRTDAPGRGRRAARRRPPRAAGGGNDVRHRLPRRHHEGPRRHPPHAGGEAAAGRRGDRRRPSPAAASAGCSAAATRSSR